jgi:hypothetical protein
MDSVIIDNTLKNQLLETKGLFWKKMNFYLNTSYELSIIPINYYKQKIQQNRTFYKRI